MAAHDPSDYEGLGKLNEQLQAVTDESEDTSNSNGWSSPNSSSSPSRQTDGERPAGVGYGGTECAKPTLAIRSVSVYRNNSAWLPVRSKNATESFDDQIASQSPALAAWHSCRTRQLPWQGVHVVAAVQLLQRFRL